MVNQKTQKRKRVHDPYIGLTFELKRRGIKYQSLSDRLQISTKTISDKINGWRDFTMDEIEAICNLLNCSSSIFTQKVTQ